MSVRKIVELSQMSEEEVREKIWKRLNEHFPDIMQIAAGEDSRNVGYALIVYSNGNDPENKTKSVTYMSNLPFEYLLEAVEILKKTKGSGDGCTNTIH